MVQISAGLLMYRMLHVPEFFLVHPGGPFYKNKNDGVWTIPKGLTEPGEDFLSAAIREFHEETGIQPTPPYHELGSVKMKSGKTIHAWSFAGEWIESEGITSNTFPLEWPPRSGKTIEVPEVDQAMWCPAEKAKVLIHGSQVAFIEKALSLMSNHR